jgi:hypothetical protein
MINLIVIVALAGFFVAVGFFFGVVFAEGRKKWNV